MGGCPFFFLFICGNNFTLLKTRVGTILKFLVKGRGSYMSEKRRDICALVLSAGKGTRMKSPIPKVLHTLLGEHMLWYVHQGIMQVIKEDHIFYVLGYMAELIENTLSFVRGNVVYQTEQLGTGHALQCAYPHLMKQGFKWCLIVNGDVPLLDIGRVNSFIEEVIQKRVSMGLMTITLDDPRGYGRIVRDSSGNLLSIVEEKDISTNEVRGIKEVNAGVYIVNLEGIKDYLNGLTNDNAQKEYYLPQLVELLLKDNKEILAKESGNDKAFLGINSGRELIECEEILRQRIIDQAFDSGVVIYNPSQVRIGPKVKFQTGSVITGPVELYGDTKIESGVSIDSHVWIKDSEVCSGTRIYSFSHIEGAIIGPNSKIGPFARLRPGTRLIEGVKVGNFVEVKKSVLNKGVKASHLTYLGDSFIDKDTNIGAGTITCNYDGKSKHVTHIGKSVFVGSNTSLVAPVKVGDNALIGAGSTITKDVPNGALAIARGRQKNLNKRIKS